MRITNFLFRERFVLLGVMGALLLVGGCKPGEGKPEAAETSAAVEEVSEKGTVTLSKEALAQAKLSYVNVEAVTGGEISVTGVVEASPNGVGQVTATAPGRVVQVLAAVGDSVRAGETLAVLESTELATVQREARVASARRASAEVVLERQRRLAKLGEFGRPRLEDAQAALAEAQGAVNTSLSEVTRAKAELAEAQSEAKTQQAAVEQTEARVTVARTRRDRAVRLLKEQLISQQEGEQAQADAESAEADVRAAKAEQTQAEAHIASALADAEVANTKLKQAREQVRIARQASMREEAVFKGGYLTSREIVEAEAAVHQARIEERSALEAVRLAGGRAGAGNRLVVASPMAGQVMERLVSPGQSVGGETVLFQVVNLKRVSVVLSVFATEAASVRVSQAVMVMGDAAPGRRFAGRVASVGGADPATGAVRVRVSVEESGGLLRPGGFVRAQVATGGGKTDERAVPQEAIQEVEEQKVVFVPTETEGVFRAVPVTVGAALSGGRRRIQGSVSVGQRVVAGNAFTLKAQSMQGELTEE